MKVRLAYRFIFFHVNQTNFHTKRFCMRTCFETEARCNSTMAHYFIETLKRASLIGECYVNCFLHCSCPNCKVWFPLFPAEDSFGIDFYKRSIPLMLARFGVVI